MTRDEFLTASMELGYSDDVILDKARKYKQKFGAFDDEVEQEVPVTEKIDYTKRVVGIPKPAELEPDEHAMFVLGEYYKSKTKMDLNERQVSAILDSDFKGKTPSQALEELKSAYEGDRKGEPSPFETGEFHQIDVNGKAIAYDKPQSDMNVKDFLRVFSGATSRDAHKLVSGTQRIAAKLAKTLGADNAAEELLFTADMVDEQGAAAYESMVQSGRWGGNIDKSVEDNIFAQNLGQMMFTVPLMLLPGAGLARVGQIAAAGSINSAQLFNEGYTDAIEKGSSVDKALDVASIYTIAAAPMDTFSDVLMGGGGKLFGSIFKSAATAGKLQKVARIGAKAGISAAFEGVTEGAQYGLLQAIQGDEVDQAEFWANVRAGALLGAFMNGSVQGIQAASAKVEAMRAGVPETAAPLSDEQKAEMIAERQKVVSDSIVETIGMGESARDVADAVAEVSIDPDGNVAPDETTVVEVVAGQTEETVVMEAVAAEQAMKEPQAEGIPVMITQSMRNKLYDAGYTEQDVDAMTPKQAWDNLNASRPAGEQTAEEPMIVERNIKGWSKKPIPEIIKEIEPDLVLNGWRSDTPDAEGVRFYSTGNRIIKVYKDKVVEITNDGDVRLTKSQLAFLAENTRQTETAPEQKPSGVRFVIDQPMTSGELKSAIEAAFGSVAKFRELNQGPRSQKIADAALNDQEALKEVMSEIAGTAEPKPAEPEVVEEPTPAKGPGMTSLLDTGNNQLNQRFVSETYGDDVFKNIVAGNPDTTLAAVRAEAISKGYAGNAVNIASDYLQWDGVPLEKRRPVSPAESEGLRLAHAARKNEIKSIDAEIAQATGNEPLIKRLLERKYALGLENEIITKASQLMNSTTGLSLGILSTRGIGMEMDFDASVAEIEAANGKPMTEVQKLELKKALEAYEKADKKVADAEVANAEEGMKAAVKAKRKIPGTKAEDILQIKKDLKAMLQAEGMRENSQKLIRRLALEYTKQYGDDHFAITNAIISEFDVTPMDVWGSVSNKLIDSNATITDLKKREKRLVKRMGLEHDIAKGMDGYAKDIQTDDASKDPEQVAASKQLIKDMTDKLNMLKSIILKEESDVARKNTILARIETLQEILGTNSRKLKPVQRVVSKESAALQEQLDTLSKMLAGQDKLAGLEEMLRTWTRPAQDATYDTATGALADLKKRITELTNEVAIRIKPTMTDAKQAQMLDKLMRQRDAVLDQVDNLYRELPKLKATDSEAIIIARNELSDALNVKKMQDEKMEYEHAIRTRTFDGIGEVQLKKQSSRLLKARAERDAARRHFFERKRMETGNKFVRFIDQLTDLPRNLILAADIPIMRHGAVIMANPFAIGDNAKIIYDSLKAYGSGVQAFQVMDRMRQLPTHLKAVISGIRFPDVDTPLAGGDEIMGNGLLQRIPIIGQLAFRSGEAQNVMVSLLRQSKFDWYLNRYPDATDTELKYWAEHVNTITGTANWKGTGTAEKVLNKAFISTRFMVSRFKAPYDIAKSIKAGQMRVARAQLEDWAWYFGTRLMALASLKMLLGDDIEVNITDLSNSNFGKVQYTNERGVTRVYDPWSGYQQAARLFLSLPAEFWESQVTGEDEFDLKKTVSSYLEYRLNPIFPSAMMAITGEDVFGQEVTMGEAALRSGAPLILQNVIESIMNENGAEDALSSAFFDFIGAGSYVED